MRSYVLNIWWQYEGRAYVLYMRIYIAVTPYISSWFDKYWLADSRPYGSIRENKHGQGGVLCIYLLMFAYASLRRRAVSE